MVKKAKQVEVEMPFNAGDQVVFQGYDADTPEEERFLEEGAIYEVDSCTVDDDGSVTVLLKVENPDFNPKKKPSATNEQWATAEVFPEEIVLAEDEEEEGEEETEEEGEEAEETAEAEEAEEEEPEPAKPAKKTTAKANKTAPVKASTKASAKAPGKPAKATAKPAKAAQEEEAEPEDEFPDLENEDATIVSLVEDAEDLNALVIEQVEEAGETDYRLGGLLYHVYKSKSYVELDEAYGEAGGFAQYVQNTLGFSYRKARHLIKTYVTFNVCGITGEQMAEIGWTKASKIATVMEAANAQELMELAGNSTVAELDIALKEDYKDETKADAGTKQRKVAIKFRLPQDRAEFVLKLLDQAHENTGAKKMEDTFEQIVVDWAVTNLGVERPPVKVAARKGKKAKEEVVQAEAKQVKAAPGKKKLSAAGKPAAATAAPAAKAGVKPGRRKAA